MNYQDEEKLKKIAEDTYYEVDMFFQTAYMLGRLAQLQAFLLIRWNVIGNSLLESFLLHFRNLRDFFYPEKPHQYDVLAEHFLVNWNDKRPEMPETFSKLRDNVNKRVAHISYKRLEFLNERDWPTQDMLNDVKKVWDSFYNGLTEDKRK